MDKKKLNGLPVFYVDRLNYTDIAYILRDLFIIHFANTPLTANDNDLDMIDLVNYLENNLLPEGISDFMNSDFGKGAILGMYLEHKSELDKQDEINALKEMDEEA